MRVARVDQLNESELQQLVEEHRQLRARLLQATVDSLPADQIEALRQKCEEARAVAASRGLDLGPLTSASGAPGGARSAVVAAASAPAAADNSKAGGKKAGKGKGGKGGKAGPAASSGKSAVPDGLSGDAVSGPEQQQDQDQNQGQDQGKGATASESDFWIDERGRKGEDDDRLSPLMSAEQKAAREEREAALRSQASSLVSSHDPAAVAADRHHWLVFTVPEVPVAGADCVVYFNKAQSTTLAWTQPVNVLVGYNQWQLNGEKLPLKAGAIKSKDGSDFWSVQVSVPREAFEINMVFGDDLGNYDNNQGQDFTFGTEGGLTFEEWVDGAPDRAIKAEAEEVAKREAADKEAAAAALAAAVQRDEDEAQGIVQDLRSSYGEYRMGGLTQRRSDDDKERVLWKVEGTLRAGGRGTLLYNTRAPGCPLAWLDPSQGHAPPTLTLGFNNWRVKPAPPDMTPATAVGEGEEGDLWWSASFDIPPEAAAVSFCVNSGDSWDNNWGYDHKALIEPPAEFDASPDPAAAWFDAMLPALREAARERREAAEADAAAKAAKREQARVALRDDAMTVLRRQLKHVLFTEPEVVRAGEKVTVYYSPASTVLAGRDQIYVTAGFNRWGHPRKIGPAAMRPPGEGGLHHRATFMVPRDAHMLDVVLSDVPGGEGTYDNRGGLDYHIPVEGGVGAKPQPLHVVHVAVEMAPIAKVGGLGDVVTSLGRAVKDQGHLVEVILPWYQFFGASPLLHGRQFEAEFDWGGTHVVVTSCVVEGLRVFFVDPHNGMFNTDSVYGRNDDEVRFDFFCRAALEFLLQTQRQPDILHCHDWQTAHMAKAYWDDYHPFGLWKPKVVFTIHNMNYGQRKIGEAAYYCQKFTTVSPSYAFEVGGHPAIAAHNHKMMGILNGIDPELWDPMEDPWLPAKYDASTCEEGKAAARAELRRRLNMSPQDDRLIVAVVSRLTGQKGVHLIKHAAWRARDRGGQFVLLGSAPDPKVQGEFNALAGQLSGGWDNNAAFCFYYDEPLSHLIYAAADIVVVPSMFEPCGLTQMIAMRYGAVPVVRHTGGLHDTVFDVDTDKGRAAWQVAGSSDWEKDGPQCTNGFAFEGADAGGLDYALNRAIDAYYNDKGWFRGLQARNMRMDWSWNRPALNYIDLYYAATKS